MCCGGRESEWEVGRGKERLTQHTDTRLLCNYCADEPQAKHIW